MSPLMIPVAAFALLATLAPAPRPFAPSRSDSTPTARVAVQGALTDPQIAAIFEAANTLDIETGGVAARRGSTKTVRHFGAQLVRDHKSVRGQGRALVKKLGVKAVLPKDNAIVTTLVKDHTDAMKALNSAKKGADFDRAFLQHEVGYHKAVIDAVNSTLLPAIKNAELKTLVTTVAPAFQAHMVEAQRQLDAMK